LDLQLVSRRSNGATWQGINDFNEERGAAGSWDTDSQAHRWNLLQVKAEAVSPSAKLLALRLCRTRIHVNPLRNADLGLRVTD
jgi:hypothetical protein